MKMLKGNRWIRSNRECNCEVLVEKSAAVRTPIKSAVGALKMIP